MVSGRSGPHAATVILVGAGQIGSRHLQGLAKSELDLCVEIVDPSGPARELAVQRFNEIPSSGGRKTLRAIGALTESELGEEVDVAIIATNASTRLAAFEMLASTKKLKHVIFEKVLFQRIADLQKAEALIDAHCSTAWVNCPRRMFPFGHDLHSIFAGNVLSMSVQGGGWGLACNGIHFLDFIAFLSGTSKVTSWDITHLDCEIFDSKRAGCKETGGRLGFYLDGGHELTMKDDRQGAAPVVIDVVGQHVRATVFESARLMIVCNAEQNWKADVRNIEVPLQSDNTGRIVDGLMMSGRCELTPYNESAQLHAAYLTAMLEHISAVTGKHADLCPIS